MSIETIGSNINIKTADTGFFKGLNKSVSISAIAIICLFLLWVMFSQESASQVLVGIQSSFNSNFGAWYGACCVNNLCGL